MRLKNDLQTFQNFVELLDPLVALNIN